MTGPRQDRGTDESAPDGYVRGAAPRVDLRLMAYWLLEVSVVGLVSLAVLLAVQASRENATADRVRRHGVPVTATVVSCVGLASGTGITQYAYRCTADYTIRSRDHRAVALRSSTGLLTSGATVPAVVDPNHLDHVYAVAGMHRLPSGVRPFLPAAGTLAGALICLPLLRRLRPGHSG